MSSQSTGANELIELAFIFVTAGGFDFDVGGTDGFVGFLGAGGFGFEVAKMEILFAKVGFYVVSN